MATQPAEPFERALYERGAVLREAARELRALARYRELLRHLVRSSLATESTGTVFGSVWWLLDPLITMAVFYVFVELILDAGGDNYALFIFIGVTAWKHFASSVTAAINSTLMREQLMRQIAFPKSVLPLATGIAGTIHLFIALAIFMALAVPFGLYPDPIVALALVPIAIQTALMLGFSYLLSALNIFFRDVQNLSGYAFRLFFFLSPTLYTADRIPESWRPYYDLNPFATIFPAFHSILLDHEAPDWSALALVAVFSLVVLVGGFLAFARLQQSFTKVA